MFVQSVNIMFVQPVNIMFVVTKKRKTVSIFVLYMVCGVQLFIFSVRADICL
jgi:hypothetical protein